MLNQGYAFACMGCPYKRKAEDYDSEQRSKNITYAVAHPLRYDERCIENHDYHAEMERERQIRNHYAQTNGIDNGHEGDYKK